MTLEELLECDSAQLKAMTDHELLEFFRPYLCFTRPDAVAITRAVEAQPKFKKMPMEKRKASKLQEAQNILNLLGTGIQLK